MDKKRTHQMGFTLIELIIVIVIIAILAAVAIPKYLDLQNDAKKAASQGLAGALGSASAANYAIRSGLPTKGSAITSCGDVGNLLQTGSMDGFTITGGSIGAGNTASCSVDHNVPGTATSATFTGHGIN
jgi:MSHA pilin protein MshA